MSTRRYKFVYTDAIYANTPEEAKTILIEAALKNNGDLLNHCGEIVQEDLCDG